MRIVVRPSRSLRALILSGMLIGTASVAADDTGTTPPATPPPDLLRGPSVSTAGTDLPLASRGFDGELERLEGLPELLALDRLTLSPAERAPVDAVLQARARAIEDIVAVNVPLFLEAGTALMGRRDQSPTATPSDAEREAARARRTVLRKLASVMAPIEKRGTLQAEIEAALSAAHRTSFAKLINDYNAELGKDLKTRRAQRTERASALRARDMTRQVHRARLRQEFFQAYERVVVMRVREAQERAEELDVSPEIRTVMQQVAEKRRAMRAPDADVRSAQDGFMRDVYDALTPEQRRELRRALTRRNDREDA